MVEKDFDVTPVKIALETEQMYLYRIGIALLYGRPFAEIQHPVVTYSIVRPNLYGIRSGAR